MPAPFSKGPSGWDYDCPVRNSIAGLARSRSAAPSAAATIHALLVVYAGTERIFVSSPYQHSSFSCWPFVPFSVFVIVETAPSCKLQQYIPSTIFSSNFELKTEGKNVRTFYKR